LDAVALDSHALGSTGFLILPRGCQDDHWQRIVENSEAGISQCRYDPLVKAPDRIADLGDAIGARARLNLISLLADILRISLSLLRRDA
jgi:hypothetical protein